MTCDGWRVTVRPVVTSFPVPVLQADGTDSKVIALDLAPVGTPEPFGVHGYTWIDLCDKDIIAMDEGRLPAEALNCARLGINENAVWVGSVAYYGATPKPVEVVVGAVPKVRVTQTRTEVVETVTIGGTCETPGVRNPETGKTELGAAVSKQGTVYASRDNFPAAILNRNQPGQIIQLRLAGNIVGTISVAADGVTLSGFKQIDDLMARVAALEAALA